MAEKSGDRTAKSADPERRRALSTATNIAMLAGLAGGYGALALIAGRFLYPARPRETGWMFVSDVSGMKPGDSLLYEAPTGEPINVTRQGSAGTADDFIALSSTCPHLGCYVHWEAHNNRYFCPCHNGVFDPSGKGIAGPPGEAGQSLSRFNLKIDSGLLFIEVPLTSLAERGRGRIIEKVEGIHGPGHDPCLSRLARGAKHPEPVEGETF